MIQTFYFSAYPCPISHFPSPTPSPPCHLSDTLPSYKCNKKVIFL
ncbi:hypothetical protein ECP02989428_3749 [Escherichia coli P0298942.8]|nr:hypothetical protein ECP029894211_3879 [Escherichia coli P0298942.11]ENB73207.1 hypothetical protein ECP02989428_3749 [Escherichia coli P0298942.8]END64016.1 hypothetical protein ECP02989423_3983 [Escherichia coli P0298942.3]